MYCFVVLGRAGAVNAPQHPNHPSGRLDLRHAGRQSARPTRPRDGISLRLVAGRCRTGHAEHLGVAVEHGNDVVAVAHVRNAQHRRLLGDVQPCLGVQGVGVRRGAAVVVHRRIGAHPDHLPHGSMFGVRHGHVGLLHARDVKRNQGIAVEVRVNGGADRFFQARGFRLFAWNCRRRAESQAVPPGTGAPLMNFISPTSDSDNRLPLLSRAFFSETSQGRRILPAPRAMRAVASSYGLKLQAVWPASSKHLSYVASKLSWH